MIKSITIQNFESHEDTTINFQNGLCFIEGLSNSGKSSIVRSMAAVVNNRWEKSMVRNGFEFCRIRMTTDKGWVECERGEKINRWKCFDGKELQEYKAVGVGVPEQATKILGMGERNRNGIKELPNFQFQLEKHYMLSEIDGKKATSNMIARMMDSAIGLGGMEEFINALSSDLLKDRKWLAEKQDEINSLKSSIIDDVIFNGYVSLMNKVDILFNEVKSFENNIDIADRKFNEIQKIQEKIRENKNELSLFPDMKKIDELKADIEKNAKMIDVLETAKNITRSIKNNNDLLSVDIISIINLQKDADESRKKIEYAEALLYNARKTWKDIKANENKIAENEQNLIILNQEREELKKKMGVCPLCGSSFK